MDVAVLAVPAATIKTYYILSDTKILEIPTYTPWLRTVFEGGL